MHRNPSPSATSLNNGTSHLEPPQSYDALRTRVSELEVINDLFRGRVGELEQNEQAARRAEHIKDEELQRVRADLQTADARAVELEKRVAELLEASGGSPQARKRPRRAAPAATRAGQEEGEEGGGSGSGRGVESNFMMP